MCSPVVLAVLVAAASTACSIDVQGSSTVVREEKRFTISEKEPLNLKLSTFDGAIQLRSWDRNEVLVEIERRGPDKATAEALPVDVTQDGNVVSVDARSSGGGHRISVFGGWSSPAVSLRVTAPRRLTLEARTGDGSIDASDLQGSLELRSGDGAIRISHAEGQIRAHTGDGTIRADEVTGDVDVDSGDGSVSITGRLSGVTVRTGDGRVDIDASDGSATKTDWRITTGDGSITLRVPENFAAAVEASTGDGRIHIEGISGRSQDRDDSDRREVRGQLGSGGQTLRLRTSDGSITVTK